MHETFLGQTMTDYLSGQPIEATTYEDIRQALARMLVEEKGYPRSQLQSKVPIRFTVDGQDVEHRVDLVALDPQGQAVAIIIFCAGDVLSYVRETVAAARLVPQGPASLAMVTDTQSAICVCVADGSVQYEGGYHALPTWSAMLDLARQCPPEELSAAKQNTEQRLLYTFRGLIGCCSDACPGS